MIRVSLYTSLVFTVIGLSIIFRFLSDVLFLILGAGHLFICVLFVDYGDLWLLLSLLKAAAIHISILLLPLFSTWLSMFSFSILDVITLLLRIGKKRCPLLFAPSPSCDRLFHGDRWRLV